MSITLSFLDTLWFVAVLFPVVNTLWKFFVSWAADRLPILSGYAALVIAD